MTCLQVTHAEKGHFRPPCIEGLIKVSGQPTPFAGNAELPDKCSKLLGILEEREVKLCLTAAAKVKVMTSRCASVLPGQSIGAPAAMRVAEAVVEMLEVVVDNWDTSHRDVAAAMSSVLSKAAEVAAA